MNCVIVKDLNRFGRNYTVGGDLIDNYFARKNVRFIALNNGVDTADDRMNAATRCISIGVTNVINESYSAMTSVSIRGTLNNHRKQGKFIGAFACYGYQKDPEDNHKLLIDDGIKPLFPYKRPMTKDGFFRKYEYVYEICRRCVHLCDFRLC